MKNIPNLFSLFSIKLYLLILTISNLLSFIQLHSSIICFYTFLSLQTIVVVPFYCFLFLLSIFSLLPTHNDLKRLKRRLYSRLDNLRRLISINTSTFNSYHSSFFYFYPRSKCSNIPFGLIKGPNQPSKSAKRGGCYMGKV